MGELVRVPTKIREPRRPIPGFHFKPSDEILIVHYLRKKLHNQPVPGNLMPEVDVYQYTPEELTRMYKNWEQDGFWYFFTPRERKYPKGNRPSRRIKGSTSAGWIATGYDRVINSCSNDEHLGNRKTLVYHKEREVKTNWIMYEYLDVSQLSQESRDRPGNMQLDAVILCSIHENATGKKNKGSDEVPQAQGKLRRTDSVASDLMEAAEPSSRALIMQNLSNSYTSVHQQNMDCVIDQNQAVRNPMLWLTYSEAGNTAAAAAAAEFENVQNAWNATGASISPEDGLQFGSENMVCEIGQDQAVRNSAMLLTYFDSGNTEAAAEFENVQNAWNATGASISPENGLQFGSENMVCEIGLYQAVRNSAMLLTYSDSGNTEAAAEFEDVQNVWNAIGASVSPENGLQFGPENMVCEIGEDQAVGNPATLYNYSEGGNNAEAVDEYENVQNAWNAAGASIRPENSLQFDLDQAVKNPAMLHYSEVGNTAATAEV